MKNKSPHSQPPEPEKTLSLSMDEVYLRDEYSSYLATSEDEVLLDPESSNQIFRCQDLYTPEKVKIQDKNRDKPSILEMEFSIPEKATIPA
ncbi:hypothetical protein JTB14_019045 [Gonioctena quinquepunctata]|nr:hypothetical protein JTB14_019045 [Gonioctena quinquepunctata]